MSGFMVMTVCTVMYISILTVILFIFLGKDFSEMKLDELNDMEDDLDEEDERIFEAYR